MQFAILAAFISGVSVFINKFAVSAFDQPLVFTTVKNTCVGFLIFGLLLTSRKWRQINKLKPREVFYLILIGVIGGSIPFYLFFTGLSTIPAINGAIIQKTLVIWVAILAGRFLKEGLSKRQIFIILMLFGANYLTGGFRGFTFTIGEGLVLLATCLWAAETVLAKKVLPSVDPDILTFARMGFGALILVLFTAGLLLMYVTFWYRALKYAPATTVTAVLVASTLVTNVLTAIFVTHTLDIGVMVQSVLIALGVLVISRWSAKSQQGFVGPVT
jgi:drug/metabolite transporter (DMT)-like permease